MSPKDQSNAELEDELIRLRIQVEELREQNQRHLQVESALRNSESRYRLLTESSPDAIILYNTDGRVLYVNPAFEKIYGWSSEEWLGKRIDFVPPEEVEITNWGLQETVDGRNADLETRRLTKDGRLLDVQLKTASLPGPDGSYAGMYVIHRDITEAKANRIALIESERRYRQLLDASPDPITVYDDQGTVTYVNPAFEQTFGWSGEDLAGRGIDFVPEHEIERTRAAVQRTLQGESVTLETQRLTKDGRLLDIQLKTAVFTDPEGKLAGDIVIYRDITERKQAEEAVRHSEARYRLLLDASPDPLTVYDDQGAVTYINPVFEQTFGWSGEDLAGRGIDFVPEHEIERTRAAVQRTLQGESVTLETQRLTKDGRLLDIQLKTAVFTDPEGNLAGDIVIYRDITKRKQAEEDIRRHRDHLGELVEERTGELSAANQQLQNEIEERKRTEQALLAAESRYRQLYQESVQAEALYRSLFESSPDAIVVYGMDGEVQRLNPAFARTFGWTQKEVAGRRMDFVPKTEKEVTKRLIHQTVQKGTPCLNFETKRQTKDGQILHVNISGARFDDHAGRPAGTLAILRDTTERIEQRQERIRLEEQLRHSQKMEAVGVLASGIAHDFNNILQAISSYLQMIGLSTAGGPDASSTQLAELERLVDRGAELVRGLLTFGRKVEPKLNPMQLNRTVQDTARMLQRTIPKMIHIDTWLEPELYDILGDPNQLEQAIINLAGNAGDAMPEGGHLVIETANLPWEQLSRSRRLGLEPGPYVMLRVSDTGWGMDFETVEHIFEPFYTTKGVSEGTGLGLSTIYGIVKGHHGHIVCHSKPGLGSAFEIYLPAVKGARDMNTDHKPPDQPQSHEGNETVLLVDDESSIREIGCNVLTQFGYQTLSAASGEEALELFSQRHQKIDLVLMDLGMPGMGGLKALQEMIKINAQAKVVIASGYSGPDHAKQATANGAAAFMAKPYRMSQMLECVRQVLDAS